MTWVWNLTLTFRLSPERCGFPFPSWWSSDTFFCFSFWVDVYNQQQDYFVFKRSRRSKHNFRSSIFREKTTSIDGHLQLLLHQDLVVGKHDGSKSTNICLLSRMKRFFCLFACMYLIPDPVCSNVSNIYFNGLKTCIFARWRPLYFLECKFQRA